MPLRRLGLGSKRMLTTGLQKQALRAPHITLFDEVEVGLEPHRIARLLQHLKKGRNRTVFPDHSLARRAAGTDRCRFAYRPLRTWVHQCDNCCRNPRLPIPFKGKSAPAPKRSLRPRSSFAKAPPKSVFCAAWTIIGLNLRTKIHSPIAALPYSMPRALARSRGLPRPFKHSAIMLPSSPIPMSLTTSQMRMQKPCVTAGITVVKWGDALSIEERVFTDLPWPGVMSSFDAVRSIWNDDAHLLDQVKTQFGQGFDRDFESMDRYTATAYGARRDSHGRATGSSDKAGAAKMGGGHFGLFGSMTPSATAIWSGSSPACGAGSTMCELSAILAAHDGIRLCRCAGWIRQDTPDCGVHGSKRRTATNPDPYVRRRECSSEQNACSWRQ